MTQSLVSKTFISAMSLTVFCTIMMFCFPTHAVVVKNMYNTTWPVEDRSKAVREQAITEAMIEVLIRVTGNQQIHQTPEIQKLLQQSTRYIQSFHYAANNHKEQEGASLPLVLHTKFDKRLIDKAIRRAGANLWSANRPQILTWIAQRGNRGSKQIIFADSDSVIHSDISSESRRRGLPIKLPSSTDESVSLISVNDIWAHYQEPVQNISRPYNANALLMVSVEGSGSRVQSRWTLIDDCGSQQWRYQSTSLRDAMTSGIDGVANFLGECYSLNLSSATAEELSVVVSPVRNVQDYGRVIGIIEKLVAVKSVNVVELNERKLTLSVNINGSQEDFKNAIKLSRKLHLVDDLNVSAQGQQQMVFKWVP